MLRRSLLLGTCALALTPGAVRAQPPGKLTRIGRLSPQSAEVDAPFLSAFRQALQELGWVEGRTFTVVGRFADGKPDRLPQLAASLVQDGVDVILAGSNPGALAAKRATSTVPIVMVTTGEALLS